MNKSSGILGSDHLFSGMSWQVVNTHKNILLLYDTFGGASSATFLELRTELKPQCKLISSGFSKPLKQSIKAIGWVQKTKYAFEGNTSWLGSPWAWLWAGCPLILNTKWVVQSERTAWKILSAQQLLSWRWDKTSQWLGQYKPWLYKPTITLVPQQTRARRHLHPRFISRSREHQERDVW